MFSQVDRSLERSQGGLGIGLSLVKRLPEMHGGKIEAKSNGPGQGAEFIVRLPHTSPTNVSSNSSNNEHSPSQPNLRILIVDDNRDGADSLAMMLKMFGNETKTAYDGEQAVELCMNYEPDVLLLDLGLPKLNGYDACRQIRQQSSRKPPVIIAQTGWGQEEDRQRTREAGFDYHMVKPIDPAALMSLLSGLAENKS